jgi:hypothetical protein
MEDEDVKRVIRRQASKDAGWGGLGRGLGEVADAINGRKDG